MNWRAMFILAVSSCISATALADGFYMGEKASAINFQGISTSSVLTEVVDTGTATTTTVTTVNLGNDSDLAKNLDIIVGNDFNDFFAIEGSVSGSLLEGKYILIDTTVTPNERTTFEGLEFESLNLYGVFKTPTNPYFRGRLGFARNKFEFEGITTPQNETSASYGIGIGYKFKSGIRLELDATVLNQAYDSVDTVQTSTVVGSTTVTDTLAVTTSYDDLVAIQFGLSVPFESDEIGGFIDQSKFYYGVNLNAGDLDNARVLVASTNGLGLKLGREFGKYLGAEFHLGVSADSTNDVISDPEINYSAVFARFNLPLETVSLYALLGRSEVHANIVGGLNNSEKDFAKGFGVDLITDETLSLHIESITYGDDQFATQFKVLSVGFTRRFDLPSLR